MQALLKEARLCLARSGAGATARRPEPSTCLARFRPQRLSAPPKKLGVQKHPEAFFNVFSEYRTSTKVSGRVVSVVELPDFDFVVLDSLDELPDLKPRQATKVSGTMDKAQLEWLESFLATAKRPVVLSSHHSMGELPGVEGLIVKYPEVVAGYIYGHHHIWNNGVSIIRPLAPRRMVPHICIPTTFYGDISRAFPG